MTKKNFSLTFFLFVIYNFVPLCSIEHLDKQDFSIQFPRMLKEEEQKKTDTLTLHHMEENDIHYVFLSCYDILSSPSSLDKQMIQEEEQKISDDLGYTISLTNDEEFMYNFFDAIQAHKNSLHQIVLTANKDYPHAKFSLYLIGNNGSLIMSEETHYCFLVTYTKKTSHPEFKKNSSQFFDSFSIN